MSFSLQNIVRASDTFSPQRIIIYGVQGLGKTTFGATFENPILLRTEDGAGAIDIPTFPSLVTSLQDFYAAVNSLIEQDHNFKTLVLDSLDWMEPLVFANTCALNGWNSIEDPSYGKGYVAADDDWRTVLGFLDSLRHSRNMNIVVIAHSEIKTFNPPDSDPFDRYQIRLHKRAFALWQEWADMVLFCNYKKNLVAVSKEKQRAEGTGDRIIFTQERPAFLAKNRWALPSEILIGKDLTWSRFHDEMTKATNGKYHNPIQQKEIVKTGETYVN